MQCHQIELNVFERHKIWWKCIRNINIQHNDAAIVVIYDLISYCIRTSSHFWCSRTKLNGAKCCWLIIDLRNSSACPMVIIQCTLAHSGCSAACRACRLQMHFNFRFTYQSQYYTFFTFEVRRAIRVQTVFLHVRSASRLSPLDHSRPRGVSSLDKRTVQSLQFKD